MTQKGWGYRRLGERWLSLGFPYHNAAPVRVHGTFTLTIAGFPFIFILETSTKGDTTTTPGVIEWKGVATEPSFTASYQLLQGYDQTLGEDPHHKIFLKLTIGLGLSVLVWLKTEINREGWPSTAPLIYEEMQVLANSIPLGVPFPPTVAGVTYANEP